ncbi:AI-2E family transporter [Nibrella saemangeumensis]|uniref:AI-2E family transporter n=1 Tax=Nibrella saemangeumensis TaxID=1084526 RepID=A0ABP8MVV8_9BACT
MEQPISFTRKAAIAALVSLTIASLFLLIGYAADFFFLVFGGILFGVLISGLTSLFSRLTGLRYSLSMAAVCLLILLIIGATGWLMAPSVSQQVDQLSQSLPQAIRKAESQLAKSSWGQRLLSGLPSKPSQLLPEQKDVLSRITGIFSSTLGVFVNFLIVLITGLYLASSPTSYKDGFVKLINPPYRERVSHVLDECYHTLANWFISRSITMVVVGVSTWGGLVLMGIPFAVILGIIAGVLNFIPNLGPYIALAPALLIAFAQGADMALYVFLLYMGIQSLEGYILTPLLDKKFVSTPPALLLFGQVLLGLLVGLVGVLFASPLIAVLLVIVNELFVKDVLEKRHAV